MSKENASPGITLVLATLLLSMDSASIAATRETVTDFYGSPIGTIKKDGDRSEVSDFYGMPLGSADRNGTRDFLGRPISPNNVPGLLFSPEHNPMLKEERVRVQKEKEARDRDAQETQEWLRKIKEDEARQAREWQENRESEFAAAQNIASERLRKPLSYRAPQKARKIKHDAGPNARNGKAEAVPPAQGVWLWIQSAWARYRSVTSSTPRTP